MAKDKLQKHSNSRLCASTATRECLRLHHARSRGCWSTYYRLPGTLLQYDWKVIICPWYTRNSGVQQYEHIQGHLYFSWQVQTPVLALQQTKPLPVMRGRSLWRFTSHPSTWETMYLSWLAWPSKWQSRLTDIEWDIKEPLRTSSLAVTTLSVPVCLKYIPHIHARCHDAVTWACDFGLKGLGCGSWLLQCGVVSLGKTLHLYHMHVHTLDPGVNGYLVRQWLLVCLNSYQCHDGSWAVRSPGVELVLEQTGPITRENWCEAHRHLI